MSVSLKSSEAARAQDTAVNTGSTPSSTGSPLTPWLVGVLVVVLYSGGLFDYDQGVISGALTGIKATFWLLAAFSVIGWVWVYVYVPETKGQSLEQIQGLWKGLRK